MKVHYSEDLASHTGPKPCVVFREEPGEASAGERVGWPLSHESGVSRVPTALPVWKATRNAASSRAAVRPGVVRDPSMHGCFLSGSREISGPRSGVARRGAASGRPDGRSR